MDNASQVLVDAGVTLLEAPPVPAPIRTSTSSSSHTATRRSTRATKMFGLGSKSKSSTLSPASTSSPQALKRTSSKKTDEPFVCQICFNDEPNQQMLALDCDHAFCKDCWNDYVVLKIRDESEHAVRCMAEGCALIAPDQFIRELLLPAPGAPLGDTEKETQNAKIWARFQELIVRHFVACNKNLKFCPYPSCTNTVSCPSAASKASLSSVVPSVSCGARGIGSEDMETSRSQLLGPGLQGKEHKFCFGCAVESDHRPVVCAVAKMWLKKCRDDSETANWIKSNTKECPTCQSTIEKNGGCK